MNNIMNIPGEMSLELIGQQLHNIINYDPAQTVDHHGNVLPLNEIPADTRSAIASYEPSAQGTKVRSYNKLTAMALALRLRGFEQLEEKSTASDEETLADAANVLDMPELAATTSGELEEDF